MVDIPLEPVLASPVRADGSVKLGVVVDPDLLPHLRRALGDKDFALAGLLLSVQTGRNTGNSKQLEASLDGVGTSVESLAVTLASTVKQLHGLLRQANIGIQAIQQSQVQVSRDLASNTMAMLRAIRAIDLGATGTLGADVQQILALLKKQLYQPQFAGYRILSQRNTDMGLVILYEVGFNPITDRNDDTVTRELTISTNGVTDVRVYSRADVLASGLEGPVAASVSLSLVHKDAAGNASTAATLGFTLDDTVPPPAPGDMRVAFVGQRMDADPEPTPEPAPEPVPEPTPEPSPDEPPA